MGRIYAWGAALQMALRHPFSGVGINNFLANYWAYSSHWDGKNHAVHSTWFGILAETGLVGFILFMTMVIVTLRSAISSIRRLTTLKEIDRDSAGVMAEAVAAGLIGFMVSGTFLTMGFTWPLYILLALTTAVSHHAKRLVP
jgi:putative inorganic carbon (HCO3(-)) transporter